MIRTRSAEIAPVPSGPPKTHLNRDISPIPANPRRFSGSKPESNAVSFCTILYHFVP